MRFSSFMIFALFLGLSLPIIPTYAEDRATLDIRSLQSRDFTDIDKQQAFSAAISTMQDLGFIITEISYPLGLIEANQTHPNHLYIVRATLTLSTISNRSNGITARISLGYSPFYAGEEGTHFLDQYPRSIKLIRDPKTYQQFFDAFSYSLNQKIN